VRLREPLLLPFASVAAGITLARYAPFPLRPVLLAAAALALLAAAAWAARCRWLTLVCTLTALVFGGIALAVSRPAELPPGLSVPDNTPAIFEGCVVDPALLAADRERFTIELAPGARAQVSLFAREGEHFPDLPYGTRVEFPGKVRRTHNYRDPGVFDVVNFLARQHIFWNATADAGKLRVLGTRAQGKGCGNRLAAFIFALRSAGLERLDRLYANDAYANGMLQATLLGANAKLDRMWTEDYRSTGTFHVLVISGSHVAVLAAVFLFLLRICALPRSLALSLTILMAWFYAGVTGWQTPAIRSAAGISLFGIGRFFFREGRLLNIVAGVALCFVVLDPAQLFDSSFQLSFLAVGVIGALAVPVLNATSAPFSRSLKEIGNSGMDIRLPAKSAEFRVEMRLLARALTLALGLPARLAHFIVTLGARVGLYLWEIFVTTFFIQVGLALPMIVYFHRLSASGLTANAVVVPVFLAIIPLGFLAIATHSHTVAWLCAWLLNAARVAVRWHASWEPAWRIPAPPLWLAGLFVAALILAALRWRAGQARRWTRVAASLAVCGALATIIIHPFPPLVQRGKFELTAIDVGQGDSLLVTFPAGKLMLIDAGGIPSFGRAKKPGIDVGEDVVSPYLWSRSITHLDVVAVTHGHEDHIGGINAVLRNFHPSELWTGATEDSPEWRSVRETAARLGIPILEKRRSEPFDLGGATLQVLAPGPVYTASSMPTNDDSLVLWVKFGGTAFLLTGDMEKKIEAQLVAEGLLRHADVLKVGHHGSRTSSTGPLLDAVHPAFGVISVGFDNTYGHPNRVTMDALKERRIDVWRTDEDGLVTVVSDGRRLSIDTAGRE
jgi:competence protein ComEC